MGLKIDPIVRNPPGEAYRRRALICGGGLSRRVPKKIAMADGLVIKSSGQGCCRGAHLLVSINGLEFCPISAMLFLAAAKLYRWSDELELALNRIMEVSRIEN